MRNTFINELHKLATKDPNIFLVVGDLGYSVVEKFATELPEQFLNAGVAEQNMTGMAAGLSLASQRNVFTYSIANFPTLRCFEQIRNDVCYHNANVKVISVGSGLAYGTQGYTHYGVEDVGVMRTLPNMVVASPADPLEATALAHLAAATHGPWYIRLGKNKEPHLYSGVPKLQIGMPLPIKPGKDGLILSSGPITIEAVNAAKALAPALDVAVVSVPFLKPMNENAILDLIAGAPWVVTVEEHSQFGGLFSAVSDILVRAQLPKMPKIRGIYLPEKLDKLGEQEFLRKHYGIDSTAIAALAKAI